MRMRIPALFGIASILGLLAGCADRDPYRRTDVWYPSGVNAGNIAAMVADPNDLIRGHGVQTWGGKEAATSIDHIWTDKPKPLPDPEGGSSGGSSGGGGGGAGAGG